MCNESPRVKRKKQLPIAGAPKRHRPLFTTTLAADVVAELRRRAADSGDSISGVTEAALRRGLGLPAG